MPEKDSTDVLIERLANFEQLLKSHNDKLDSLTATVAQMSRTNWPILLAGSGVFLTVLLGGLGFLGGVFSIVSSNYDSVHIAQQARLDALRAETARIGLNQASAEARREAVDRRLDLSYESAQREIGLTADALQEQIKLALEPLNERLRSLERQAFKE